MGHHADRCHSSEQALNQLLSVQRAFLEQRDEILNGVLHTLLLLGRLHVATITADAQRWHSPADRRAYASLAVRWNALLGSRSLLNDRVRSRQDRGRDGEPQGFSGLHVDDQFEL